MTAMTTAVILTGRSHLMSITTRITTATSAARLDGTGDIRMAGETAASPVDGTIEITIVTTTATFVVSADSAAIGIGIGTITFLPVDLFRLE